VAGKLLVPLGVFSDQEGARTWAAHPIYKESDNSYEPYDYGWPEYEETFIDVQA